MNTISHGEKSGNMNLKQLLDEIHNIGLKSVDSEVIAHPSENEPRVVVKVTITTKNGTFSGIGDVFVDDNNKHAAYRKAETLALCRAIRWDANIPESAMEEFLDLDAKSSTPATEKQIEFIKKLGDKKEISEEVRELIREKWDTIVLPPISQAEFKREL